MNHQPPVSIIENDNRSWNQIELLQVTKRTSAGRKQEGTEQGRSCLQGEEGGSLIEEVFWPISLRVVLRFHVNNEWKAVGIVSVICSITLKANHDRCISQSFPWAHAEEFWSNNSCCCCFLFTLLWQQSHSWLFDLISKVLDHQQAVMFPFLCLTYFFTFDFYCGFVLLLCWWRHPSRGAARTIPAAHSKRTLHRPPHFLHDTIMCWREFFVVIHERRLKYVNAESIRACSFAAY